MSQKTEDRPPLRRREKQPLEMIIVAASEIGKHKADLKDRIYQADPSGNAWRNLNCALGLISRVQQIIYRTVPLKQLLQIKAICKSGIVVMHTDPTLLPKNYMPISEADLNVICAAAVNENCNTCMLDAMQCTSCQLRKTLLAVWPPKEYNKYGRCPYQDLKWAKDATEAPEEEDLQ